MQDDKVQKCKIIKSLSDSFTTVTHHLARHLLYTDAQFSEPFILCVCVCVCVCVIDRVCVSVCEKYLARELSEFRCQCQRCLHR